MKELKKAMQGLRPLQKRMALILYRFNGLEMALEFVEEIKRIKENHENNHKIAPPTIEKKGLA